ncbi:fibronectin type III domain-containing protein [Spirosoma sp. BT702]|uniref:Fibronectin type III domain-containing protein n=1 Tax=Spirosoma profusum TaxID=2771354 RepID=A0A927AVD2_9BACT|nr:fibronectin type III domain-containing protein [Spirosoma profusum]MBD2705123.1 fibronectin type III domain-containing protein [Spirosoma profusum]
MKIFLLHTLLTLLILSTESSLALTIPKDSSLTTQVVTANCDIPQNFQASYGTSTTYYLNWTIVIGSMIRYRVRYRSLGYADWIEEPITPNPHTKLTALTNGVTYEAQVQTLCDNQPTGYSSSVTFTTMCQSPLSIDVYEVKWTSALALWGNYGPEVIYEIRWRPVGAQTWPNNFTLATTSYEFTDLAPETSYEFQLKTRCSDGNVSDYSTSYFFRTTNCPLPLSVKEYDLVNTQIQLAWLVNYDQIVDLHWRLVGSPTWTVIENLPAPNPNQGGGQATGSYILDNLTPNAVYEWGVQSICSSESKSSFTAPRTFTAICGKVDFMGEFQIQPTSAEIYWRAVYGISYRVQWRSKNPANNAWQTLPDQLMQSFGILTHLFNGLTPGEEYEWRIMTVCSANSSSSYTEPRSFTTTCAPPGNCFTDYSTSSSARVMWSYLGPDAQYRVRWRREEINTWTEGQPTSNAYYDINSLQPGIHYWQVQRICNDRPGSYSSDNLFIAYCYPVHYLSTTGVSSTSAQIQWKAFDNNTNYKIQWRPSGTEGWPQSATTTAVGMYKLNKLLPETNYEWRVQTLCHDTNQSDFSEINSFTTGLAPSVVTIKAGVWTDPSIWSVNRVPTEMDLVEIHHAVTVLSGTSGKARIIQYSPGGKLTIDSTAQLKIH